MLVWLGLSVGVIAGLITIFGLGKEKDWKIHLSLTFGLSFYLLFSVLLNDQEHYENETNLIISFCILPLLYTYTISLNSFLLTLALQLSALIGIYIYGHYNDCLDMSLLNLVQSYLSLGFSIPSLCFCTFFAAYGYSQIPDLLINPPLRHLFKKNFLEASKFSIQRAISNIQYQFICRGLPTPIQQKHNLKIMETELEEVNRRIYKMEKKIIDNKIYSGFSVFSGIFIVCAGFWIFAALMAILLEGAVVSKCG